MLDRDSLKNPQDALQNLSRISLDDVIRVRIIKHGASLYGVASQWTPEVHERIPNTAHAIEPTEILLREPSDSKSLLKEFAPSAAFKVIAPGGVELGGHHALDERGAECCGRHNWPYTKQYLASSSSCFDNQPPEKTNPCATG